MGLPRHGGGFLALKAGCMPSQRDRPLQGQVIPFHRHPTTSGGIPAALRRKAAASAPLENEQTAGAIFIPKMIDDYIRNLDGGFKKSNKDLDSTIRESNQIAA